MSPRERVAALQNRAVERLGERRATKWVHTANRRLSQLTPYELAETSDAGYRIALGELETRAIILNVA